MRAAAAPAPGLPAAARRSVAPPRAAAPALLHPSARSSFERLVRGSLLRTFTVDGVPPAIRTLEQLPKASPRRPGRVMMLTIATPEFRLMLSLMWHDTEAVRACAAQLARRDEALDDRAFVDVMAETCNQCWGMLNRDLVRFFPHIGMSTPALLGRGVMDQHAVMQAAMRHDVEVSCGQAVFVARLHLCVDEPVQFDARTDDEAAPAEATGEMELL